MLPLPDDMEALQRSVTPLRKGAFETIDLFRPSAQGRDFPALKPNRVRLTSDIAPLLLSGIGLLVCL